jgi:capsule polysaccharide modification protein KpsS
MPGNVLLLQGPMGPFFKRFAQDLEGLGARVYKINFNTGDRLFYRTGNIVDFAGTPSEWPAFLKDRLEQWHIDRIYLFGDTRPCHTGVRELAHELSIDVFVFEEGYLRPHYITLEKSGVNGHSKMPRDPAHFSHLQQEDEEAPRPVPNWFTPAAWYANWYYIAGWLGRRRFPHYRHHRPFNPYHEAFFWVRGGLRKLFYMFRERKVLDTLVAGHSKQFYLVPLQVHSDAQIRRWSDVNSAAAFIRRVISSFSRHAPQQTLLVIKHHPLDRGYSDYTKLIRKLSEKYAVQDRVLYVHDVRLASLLDHAKGTVVINSTVGLSSLLHNTPVKVLGHAVYNMHGLVFEGALNDFWSADPVIDKRLYRQFRHYLLSTNQINGNYYRKLKGIKNCSGIILKHLGFTVPDRLEEMPKGMVVNDSATVLPIKGARSTGAAVIPLPVNVKTGELQGKDGLRGSLNS